MIDAKKKTKNKNKTFFFTVGKRNNNKLNKIYELIDLNLASNIYVNIFSTRNSSRRNHLC